MRATDPAAPAQGVSQVAGNGCPAELDDQLGHRRARQPSAQDADQEADRDACERKVE